MNAARKYGNVQAETASPQRIMVLLFQTALRHIRMAQVCFKSGKRAEGVTLCTKACDIVIKLHATLDTRFAPDLCQTLASLYQFTCARLLRASTTGSAVAAHEAERAFAPLADAFEGAVAKLGRGG
jgi:flagellar secretion chaperone FliS